MDQLICPNCGAPLPASLASADVITCQYCNITFRNSNTQAPELGNLILGADFTQGLNLPGWSVPEKEYIQFTNDSPPEMRYKFPHRSGVYSALKTSGYFDNVDVSVSITFYEGNVDLISAGLLLRYRKGTGSYNAFITPLAEYAVAYYDDALKWNPIVAWTKHSALHPGLNQTNHLRFVTSEEHLHVYLNGVLATSIHDSRFDEGEVRLGADGTDKSSIDVGFSNLQLREVKA